MAGSWDKMPYSFEFWDVAKVWKQREDWKLLEIGMHRFWGRNSVLLGHSSLGMMAWSDSSCKLKFSIVNTLYQSSANTKMDKDGINIGVAT